MPAVVMQGANTHRSRAGNVSMETVARWAITANREYVSAHRSTVTMETYAPKTVVTALVGAPMTLSRWSATMAMHARLETFVATVFAKAR